MYRSLNRFTTTTFAWGFRRGLKRVIVVRIFSRRIHHGLEMMSSTQSLLEEHSTSRYNFEYMGFRSNHLSHGIIALTRLGASQDKISSFIDWYAKSRLIEPIPDEPLTAVNKDVDLLKGKRVSYYFLRDHYRTLLAATYKTMEEMIREEFPKLSLGMSGSALHGMIHLGYGYAALNKTLVCEGLAYLFHSYNPPVMSTTLPPVSKFGTGISSADHVIGTLSQNTGLRQRLREGVTRPEWTSYSQGSFQKCVTYLLRTEGDLLAEYVNSLKAPDGILDESGKVDIVMFGQKVVGIATLVYVASYNANDFFLLHGVTAAWSLLQVLPLLTTADGLEAIRHFLIVLLAVYVAQGAPALTRIVDVVGGVTEDEWEKIIDRTRALPVDTDEHVFKLVQVCSEMSRIDSDNASLFYKACITVLGNDLYSYDYPGDPTNK